MVIGDINIKLIDQARKEGTVLPLRDSHKTNELIDIAQNIII
jgi:hypothetical protein